jgi:hypothetical protein
LVWPGALWYVPGGHGWHSLDVLLGLYVPVGQGVHSALDVARQEFPQLVPARQVLHAWHTAAPELLWYVPGAQASQLVRPLPAVIVPGLHVLQIALPCFVHACSTYLPAVHAVHAMHATPEVGVLNLPSGQASHTVAPVATYAPAGQASHTPLIRPLHPLVHTEPAWQAVHVSQVDFSWLAWYLPAPQLVQMLFPVFSWYLPGWHFWHTLRLLTPSW